MSALNDVVIDGRRTAKHYKAARDELDALRADNAKLTAELAEANRQLMTSDVVESRPVTLTPRNCRACRRGSELMRESAAESASHEWRLRQYDGNYQYMNLDCVGDAIRALPPPDCGDCNPLEPVEPLCSECGYQNGQHHPDCYSR